MHEKNSSEEIRAHVLAGNGVSSTDPRWVSFCVLRGLFLVSDRAGADGGWEEGDGCQHASDRPRGQRHGSDLHLQGAQPRRPRRTTDIGHH